MLIRKLLLTAAFVITTLTGFAQSIIYISENGNDSQSGSPSAPLKTLHAAISKVKLAKSEQVTIVLRKGNYFLSKPVAITPADLNGKQLSIKGDGHVVVSGGRKLSVKWENFRDGIFKTKITGPGFESLFVNGRMQHLARYPNYDSTARVFNGTAADVMDHMKGWKNPVGAYLHGLHQGEWGSFHYRITGIKNGEPVLEGGWQNNRPAPLHPKERFVENALEALDAPSEWYLDPATNTLYYYQPKGSNLGSSTFVASHLKHLFELRGTEGQPLRNVTISDLQFAHTERTIMEHYEPLLRSDWMIYRGGAVLAEGTEQCVIRNCEFSDLGGNAVLFSGYNRKSGVTGTHIHHIGSSAICFVGDSSAVRSPAFRYEQFVPYAKIDQTPGPKNNRYPANCFADDNLIHDIGGIEKQSTGVQIEMASEIHVGHNTIYRVPRAGINIGDGAWGGHILEFNDVFETVLETGDHGAFNSWGRDRFWHPNRKTMDSLVAAHPELILLDAQKTTIIRNNRFRCDHGWDVDLDDGSSNYHIYNNVFLNGGLKFREGFQRIAENNVHVNNSFHPHVWFANSGDVFRHNIVMRPYFPIQISYWGKEIDKNLFPNEAALTAAQKNGTDQYSRFGDPEFVNAAGGDYSVAANSPALAIGFKNFDMNSFGVQHKTLRDKAEKVKIPSLVKTGKTGELTEMTLLGAKLRNVQGLGDRSAYGLPDETGVIVVAVPANSLFERSGLRTNDVILRAGDAASPNIAALESTYQQINWQGKMKVEVMRNQQIVPLKLDLK